MEREGRTKVGEGVLELVDELDKVRVHGGQRGVEVVAVVREFVESGLCKRVQSAQLLLSAPKTRRHAATSSQALTRYC